MRRARQICDQARWPFTTLYKARAVLNNLLTPANDIWARGASQGGAWMGMDMSQKPFQRVRALRWLLIYEDSHSHQFENKRTLSEQFT
jgi:hypothetical protein